MFLLDREYTIKSKKLIKLLINYRRTWEEYSERIGRSRVPLTYVGLNKPIRGRDADVH